MAGRTITIAVFRDYLEATMAKDALEEAGIMAVIIGDKMAFVHPSRAPLQLQISDEHSVEAIEILKDLKKPPQLLDPLEDGS